MRKRVQLSLGVAGLAGSVALGIRTQAVKQNPETSVQPKEERGAPHTEPDALRDHVQSASQAVLRSKEGRTGLDRSRPCERPIDLRIGGGYRNTYRPSWCSKECSLLVLWRNSGMDVRTADGSTRTPSSRPAVRTEEESVSGRSHMDFHRLDHTVRHPFQRNESHDGSHGDRHAGAAVETDSADLMIEANQDSFFQVWGERPIRYNFTSFTSCFLFQQKTLFHHG
jgi:hypothetical protein